MNNLTRDDFVIDDDGDRILAADQDFEIILEDVFDLNYVPRVEHGTELLRGPDRPFGPDVDMRVQFSFEIALSEPGLVDDEPVYVILEQLVGHTERVIKLFERFCF